jgi:hypothetical protein
LRGQPGIYSKKKMEVREMKKADLQRIKNWLVIKEDDLCPFDDFPTLNYQCQHPACVEVFGKISHDDTCPIDVNPELAIKKLASLVEMDGVK